MTPRRLQRWTSSDRPLHYRLSESESEDNYIVFDGVNTKSVSTDDLIGCDYENARRTSTRQRQMSECSDDFICFEYDESDLANCIHSDQTTDEEFSDTDDSDDESSDSEPDECVFERETHPPDSGFEERKVCGDWISIIYLSILSFIIGIRGHQRNVSGDSLRKANYVQTAPSFRNRQQQ